MPKAYDVWNLYGDNLATGSAFVIDTNGIVRWKQIYSGIHDLVTANASSRPSRPSNPRPQRAAVVSPLPVGEG